MHNWNVSQREAIKLQNDLASKVNITPLDEMPKIIAGADLSYNTHSKTVYAGFVMFDFESMEVIEKTNITVEVSFPYVPGLLSFREIPPLLQAWEKIEKKPDVVVLDGHGIAHPRRFGVACHFGLLANVPTIGCAKNILCGDFQNLAEEKGSGARIIENGKTIGFALRSRAKVKPVYISPGHLCSLGDSYKIMLQCDSGYRIPLPTREADIMVNKIRKAAGGK